MMNNKTQQLEQLYADAIYWHLVHKGYSEEKARMEASKAVKSIIPAE